MTNAELLSLIEQAAASRNLAPSTFCRLAVNDGKLPNRLARGGTVTIDTVRRIQDFAITNHDRHRRVRSTDTSPNT